MGGKVCPVGNKSVRCRRCGCISSGKRKSEAIRPRGCHMGAGVPVCQKGCSRRLGRATQPHKLGILGATLRLVEDDWKGAIATLTRAKTADLR